MNLFENLQLLKEVDEITNKVYRSLDKTITSADKNITLIISGKDNSNNIPGTYLLTIIKKTNNTNKEEIFDYLFDTTQPKDEQTSFYNKILKARYIPEFFKIIKEMENAGLRKS